MTEKHISMVLKEVRRLFFCIYVQNGPTMMPLRTLVQIISNQGDAGVEVTGLDVFF